MPSTPSSWRPDFIIALVAVVIGLCTMFVYLYQAHLMNKQIHASAWPHIEVAFSSGSSGMKMTVMNQGVGPALIKQYELVIDGTPYAESKLDSLLTGLTGKSIDRNHTAVNGRVLPAGQHIDFLEVTDAQDAAALDSGLRHHLFSVNLCYCSIYDECWRIHEGKMETCESCAPFEK